MEARFKMLSDKAIAAAVNKNPDLLAQELTGVLPADKIQELSNVFRVGGWDLKQFLGSKLDSKFQKLIWDDERFPISIRREVVLENSMSWWHDVTLPKTYKQLNFGNSMPILEDVIAALYELRLQDLTSHRPVLEHVLLDGDNKLLATDGHILVLNYGKHGLKEDDGSWLDVVGKSDFIQSKSTSRIFAYEALFEAKEHYKFVRFSGSMVDNLLSLLHNMVSKYPWVKRDTMTILISIGDVTSLNLFYLYKILKTFRKLGVDETFVGIDKIPQHLLFFGGNSGALIAKGILAPCKSDYVLELPFLNQDNLVLTLEDIPILSNISQQLIPRRIAEQPTFLDLL